MSITTIPNSVLLKLRCHCGQYLSKPPISIEDGQLVCSTCSNSHALLPIQVPSESAYEAIASLHSFPCRFQLQGCPLAIKFEEMKKHEATCPYCSYNCPFNLYSKCVWKGAVSQLYEHCKKSHRRLLLESPNFRIHVIRDYEEYGLIKIDSVLLLLQVKCSLKEDKLWFNMVCVRPEEDSMFINYTIKLQGISSKRSVILENAHPMSITNTVMVPEKCISTTISSIVGTLQDADIECHWIIEITKELKERLKRQHENEEKHLHEAQRETIKCPNCSIYMVPPIFRCNMGHLTCADCKGYYNECKLCQKQSVGFAEATDLHEVAKLGFYQCRWTNCCEKFTYSLIREHERICHKRVYRCPKCLTWSGVKEDLWGHFKRLHPEISLSVNSSVNVTDTSGVTRYMFVHEEFFTYDVYNVENGVLLTCVFNVFYLGFPSMVDCWECELTIQAVPYNLIRCAGNMFSVRVSPLLKSIAPSLQKTAPRYVLHINKKNDDV